MSYKNSDLHKYNRIGKPMSDTNKRGVENWLIEALKSYDGLMSTNPDKEHKWQAKLNLQALIQEQVRLARIDELEFLKDTLNEQRLKTNLTPEHIQSIQIIKEYCEQRIKDTKPKDSK